MNVLATAGWQVLGCEPGAIASPADLTSGDDPGWVTASVPGTVADAVGAHVDVDAQDWWYRTSVELAGPALLVADGLATVTDVWVGGRHVLRSEAMFRRHVVEVDGGGPTDIVLRFAAPLAQLGRRARPRWKTALVPDQRWRWLRTSMLGRILAAGTAPIAGPWRPLALHPLDAPVVAAACLAATTDGPDGVLTVDLDLRGEVGSAAVRVGGRQEALTPDGSGRWRTTVRVADAERWWPHTHGAQPGYDVELLVDGAPQPLGRVGFRTVEADRHDGGFRLLVNGTPVFARGVCWTPPDPVTLQVGPADLRTALRRVRDGGHNIVRVMGTTVYESDDFYAACDDLGLLVWQDAMVTTLDMPPELFDDLRMEIEQLADRLAGHPCVAVVCGGAETEQQPAMLGLPPMDQPAITDVIPGVLADRLPAVPYVRATPSGGVMPMSVSTGIAQYFGVGAYQRPLLDVRAAGVRFAAETLAFSIPPEQDSVLAAFGASRPAGHDPRWKAAVPRDASAAWDFEDVRDHYVRTLFGVEPEQVRYADPDRYLDLGRAAVAIAMTEVFTWWRRPRSGTGGGIVLNHRDVVPGAGWGLADWRGRAKAPWFALRPVLAPLAVLVSDDGADGVTVTVANDRVEPVAGTLAVTVWSHTGAQLDQAETTITVPARGAYETALDTVLGRFTDANFYYRFGPRVRDLVRVQLRPADGSPPVEYVAELGHHLRPARTGGLSAVARPDGDGWALHLQAEAPCHWIAVDGATHEPQDSWFHLGPGTGRVVPLRAVDGTTAAPRLTVRALDVTEFAVGVEQAAPDNGPDHD